MQNFRRLHVWERAHQFALDVRIATESFPRSGYSELKAQLVSGTESIPTNIVEGCGASSRKEFARYLDISIKSTFEVEYQLQLAKDYSILLRTGGNPFRARWSRFGGCWMAYASRC